MCGVMVSAVALGSVSAQTFPAKPVRIVTAQAGGGTDFVSRIIAQGLTETLKQPVVVDNRGGNVSIVADLVAKAAPDGHTLLVYAATFWVLPLMQAVSYDPMRDFAPITLATSAPNMLVVHPSLPVKTVREFVVLAKARPGTLNYGGSTAGSSTHLAVELLKSMAGIDLVRVPYKGQGPMFTALMSGEIQLTITSGAALLPHVKAGRMRALAVTSAKPSNMFPGIPTIAATVPGYESETVFAVLAPAATPATVIKLLQRNIADILNRPDVKEKLFAAGNEVVASTPEYLASTMKADMVRLGKVIRAAGIRAE
jgi:tripartite-type tricarboxylate transporter receptor subunit TctC